MYKNKSLKKFENTFSIEKIEKLESIGIEAYSKYGHDFYNYSVSDSPVNIEAINRYIEQYNLNLNDSVENLTIALLNAIENE